MKSLKQMYDWTISFVASNNNLQEKTTFHIFVTFLKIRKTIVANQISRKYANEHVSSHFWPNIMMAKTICI